MCILVRDQETFAKYLLFYFQRFKMDELEIETVNKSDPLVNPDMLRKHCKAKDNESGIEKEEQHSCDQCDYSASRRDKLKQHVNAKHFGIKYQCDMCPYEASRSDKLKVHKEAKHFGLRYPCDYCTYTATRPDRLKKHCKAKHNESTMEEDKLFDLPSDLPLEVIEIW